MTPYDGYDPDSKPPAALGMLTFLGVWLGVLFVITWTLAHLGL